MTLSGVGEQVAAEKTGDQAEEQGSGDVDGPSS